METSEAASQALYDNLGSAGRKFVENVLTSLTSDQRLDTSEIVRAMTAGMVQDSGRWTQLQQQYYEQYLDLWRNLLQSSGSEGARPVAAPPKGDRRFHGAEWRELPFFDYLKQAYLLNSNWLSEVVELARLDPPTKNKLRFFTRQMIDAAAPANFALTNPEVLKLARETNGESIARGMELLNGDLQKGRISMTDESAFEVGRNIAITPGTVVFENELLQLIQYHRSTDTVFERPLLMVPPCINKYYILDLQPDNSYVRYAVSQGHTVFMVSWRNVTEALGHITWDGYLEDGVIRAMDVVREICGTEQLNVLGFCVGGTMVGSALAVLRAKHLNPAASVTLLTAMLDFSNTGELSVYVDEAYVKQREQDFAKGGLLRGKELALTFSSLRANDLIWNYVVNNYLKGRKPDAFDLLYWNSDSTNLPGAMYAYYVRNMYLENNLRVPGKLTMCGVPVDLSLIDTPAFLLASREDHIVPWQTAYESTRLLSGPLEFVLAASGHIAGVINPASKNRRHYWTNPALPPTAEAWLAGAQQHPGSWWVRWNDWLSERAGARIDGRVDCGSGKYPAIEPAPGRYVCERCD